MEKYPEIISFPHKNLAKYRTSFYVLPLEKVIKF
jgi:hypothetical protein